MANTDEVVNIAGSIIEWLYKPRVDSGWLSDLGFQQKKPVKISIPPSDKVKHIKDPNLILLGSGTYGHVFRYKNYAIKIPTPDGFEELEKESDILVKINQLYKGDDPSLILKVVASGQYKEIQYLILEYLNGYTNLFDYICANMSKTVETGYIINQLRDGICGIHETEYAHYDMHPGNIMINPKTQKICIIDFGLSCNHMCSAFDGVDLSKDARYPADMNDINDQVTAKMGQKLDLYFFAWVCCFVLSQGKVCATNYKRREDHLKACEGYEKALRMFNIDLKSLLGPKETRHLCPIRTEVSAAKRRKP